MDSEVVGSAEISALIVHSCSHAVAAWPRWVFRGYPFVMIILAGVMRARPSAFRSHWLDGLAVRKRGGAGPRHDPAAMPAPNRVMDQGRRRSGFRPCVKKYGRYGEIQELC